MIAESESSICPINSEYLNGELKAQETSLLPDSLIDEIGTDSLSLTGYSNESFVFDPDNPNKLRSVLGTFAMANPVQFHKEDGSGYQFIAEQIAELDNRNPQIAARLALVLTRFAHIEPSRRGLMRKSVAWLSELQLSDNLQEIVTKALEAAKA